jgi:hypothetical protein
MVEASQAPVLCSAAGSLRGLAWAVLSPNGVGYSTVDTAQSDPGFAGEEVCVLQCGWCLCCMLIAVISSCMAVSCKLQLLPCRKVTPGSERWADWQHVMHVVVACESVECLGTACTIQHRRAILRVLGDFLYALYPSLALCVQCLDAMG